MPNWCENDLRIKGPPSTIAKLIEFVAGYTYILKDEDRSAVFDFNKIIPMPEELEEIITGSTFWRRIKGKLVELSDDEIESIREKYGYVSWYDWSINNWGTKWNACDSVIDPSDRDDIVVFHFNTAWSPPEPIIDRLAKLFPTLFIRHSYFERGCEYCGKNIHYPNNKLPPVRTSRAYTGMRGG